jgi:Toprim-like
MDTATTPIGAELRGTTALAWRGMAPGSRKDYGFFSVSPTTSHAIVLCESAIDALSCHALHPNYRCLSSSGARPDPAWLLALISQGFPIYCGFDADPPGDAMAQRMHDLHPSIRRLRPAAKVWNDLLRQLARSVPLILPGRLPPRNPDLRDVQMLLAGTVFEPCSAPCVSVSVCEQSYAPVMERRRSVWTNCPRSGSRAVSD